MLPQTLNSGKKVICSDAVLAQVDMWESALQLLPAVSLISSICGASRSTSSLSDYVILGILCFWCGIFLGILVTSLVLSPRLRAALYAFGSTAVASPQPPVAAPSPARYRQARALAYVDE